MFTITEPTLNREPTNRQFRLPTLFLLTLNAAAVLLPVVYFGARGWALTWMKAGAVAAAAIRGGLLT